VLSGALESAIRGAARAWHERCDSVHAKRESESIFSTRECAVNQVIYIIGLIVVVVAVLSWLGLH
jgi:hypothetical protein